MLSWKEQDYYEEQGYERGLKQGVEQGINQGYLQKGHEMLRIFLSNGGTKDMAIKMLGVTEEEVNEAEVNLKYEA